MKMGKILIILGVVMVVMGLLLQFAGRIPFFGKLPGDIRIERGNFSLYLPLTSCIIVSLVLTLILYLLGRFRH